MLAYTRLGAGAPLVLLHGLGSHRRAWGPVLPALARHFDVIAVDLPGHGESAPLPTGVEPHPRALAAAVGALLDELGIATSHVVGNSVGGWVAVEVARLRPLTSLTLLSPAGLWRGGAPSYCLVSLRLSRWLCRSAGRGLSHLVRYRLGRVLVLGQTHGRPTRVGEEYARASVDAMGSSSGFDATLRATRSRRLLAVDPVAAPVTVAFGARDRLLLPRQSRHVDQLPPGARTEMLDGCGHVPMADDPAAVTALILRSTARGAAGVAPSLATSPE